ncbi:fam-a protein [Plasmodium vinckei]|uniref:Fam-a protein n=1 Tax=Plasmodium vinckei TaxID=5860 RepID=A0A6V7SFZ3_PLAVN|nr:fam-a protein [Plasmodium vinckei]
MNKLYIKIALTLLSLVGFMENVAFAGEIDADGAKDINGVQQKNNDNISSTIYKESNGTIYIDVDDVLLTVEHVNQISELLLKLSETGVDDYSTYSTENQNSTIYSKKIGNVDIGRLHVTIPSASKYNDVLWKIWDVNDNQKSDNKIINGKISRVYSKHLILFEKESIDPNYIPPIKKYALGTIVRKSHNTTVIVSPSRAINDDDEINQETDLKEFYVKAKSIELDIDPEEALTKLGANIAGFVVKRGDDDQVYVTYINAIHDGGNSTEFSHNKRERGLTYTNILSLAQRI